MTRYKPPSSRFVITLEDHPGLEVVMRSLSVGKLMDIAALADRFQGGRATPEEARMLFAMFADRLVEWNLDDDDDNPVPATLEGAMSLEPGVFTQIFTGWFEGLTRPPKASPEPGDLADLPMTALRSVS